MSTPKARGWRRYNELQKQDEADRQAIIDGLLADLGRTPTMADRLDAETTAALHVEARRLERQKKHAQALEVRNAIIRAQRTTGMKSKPAAPAPRKSFAQKVEERAAARRAAEAEAAR